MRSLGTARPTQEASMQQERHHKGQARRQQVPWLEGRGNEGFNSHQTPQQPRCPTSLTTLTCPSSTWASPFNSTLVADGIHFLCNGLNRRGVGIQTLDRYFAQPKPLKQGEGARWRTNLTVTVTYSNQIRSNIEYCSILRRRGRMGFIQIEVRSWRVCDRGLVERPGS